jgi:hypothetical protein
MPLSPFSQSPGAILLNDLARAHPADRTLRNVLETLSAKLALSARLPVYAYEAATDGYTECAANFEALARTERESFDAFLLCLQRHMDERLEPVKPAHEGSER